MSEELTGDLSIVPTINIATTFGRKVQPRQYEVAEASVIITETFPGTMTPEELQEVVSSHFMQAKASVYEQLGIAYDQDDATGMIREVFGTDTAVVSAPARPTPTAPPAVAPRAPARSVPQGAPGRPRMPAPVNGRGTARPSSSGRPGGASGVDTEELWAELMEQPEQWVDLRPVKARNGNSKLPDFRSTWRQSGKFMQGLWLSDAPDWFVPADEGYAADN